MGQETGQVETDITLAGRGLEGVLIDLLYGST
jgi:hypothetical protein